MNVFSHIHGGIVNVYFIINSKQNRAAQHNPTKTILANVASKSFIVLSSY